MEGHSLQQVTLPRVLRSLGQVSQASGRTEARSQEIRTRSQVYLERGVRTVDQPSTGMSTDQAYLLVKLELESVSSGSKLNKDLYLTRVIDVA